jgi:integrase
MVHRGDTTAPEPGCATVRDLMELWMGAQLERADLRPRSLETMRATAAPIARGMGHVLISRVTLRTLETYRDSRLRPGDGLARTRDEQPRGRLPRVQGVSPETVARELRVLAAAWRWGRESGCISAGELPRCRLLVRPVVERHTPTMVEVAAVLRRLDGWPALAVRLLAATGCRLGEVAHARRRDLDVERAELRVVGKTGARVVPLDPVALAAVLPDLPTDPGAYLLPVTPSSALTSLRRYLDRAVEEESAARAEAGLGPLPRWTAHALRRAAVDALYRAGVDVSVAAAVLGHSPAVALRHYRRASEDDRHEAVRRARLGVVPVLGEVVPLRRG